MAKIWILNQEGMVEIKSYERRAHESLDDGSPSSYKLHLKNERKTKFRQLRVKCMQLQKCLL